MSGKTVYSLNDVHAQVILPSAFSISVEDKPKNNIAETNFANAGYFALLGSGKTLPIGNLVINGYVETSADTQPSWLNTARHELSTITVDWKNKPHFVKKSDFKEGEVKYAISGIPIIRNGYKVSMDDIKKEGYFGNELYDTWHGFLGVRGEKLVYIAAKVNFNLMPYLLEVFGISDGIKLDGGGSFILKSDDWIKRTSENRRINNIISW